MRDLEGRAAFITGGASGIGLGMARAFVEAGMKVVIADLRSDHLEEAMALFRRLGQAAGVRGLQLDVTDREGFVRAADEAERAFGPVHVLCNNAGVGIGGPIREAGYDDWDWALGVMLGGVVNGLQTFLPRLLAHGQGGHIVNTSSASALVPIPGSTIYLTAKSALIGLSECLRSELEPEGIGVSVLCPGPVQTNIRESGRTRPERYRRDSGYLERERRLQQRPNSPLWMSPEECGRRVLDGIRRDDLYIFTHREFKEGAAERFQAMLDAFPDEEVDAERAEAIRYLLSNPIFTRARRPQVDRPRTRAPEP
ncbi:MAG TPA: SDR family NAD(P)-dependent oxidoreductase [Candidatus Dormibacteraeota bacterium]|nr:SDR family NAD(P)-dependent oxidoreductase [Candidatus Dormibacteraeota bacterium]